MLVISVCEVSGSGVLAISDSGVLAEMDNGRDNTRGTSGGAIDVRLVGEGVMSSVDNGVAEYS